jgi:hypothetical protein
MQAAFVAFWQLHWQTLLYVFLCFAVGTLAGLQGVVATIPREFRMALRNANGIVYVVIRGAIPTAIYVGLHKSHLINPAIIPSWAEALILGAGGESLLRSRVLLVFKPSAAGQAPTEESKGFLDLVFWIQNFFLQRAGAQLARDRMKIVGQYFDREHLNFRQMIQDARVEALRG